MSVGGGVLREIVARFGFEVETEKLEHADEKLEHLVKKLKEFGEVLLGGVVGEALKEFAEKTAEIGHEIEKGAIQLGISTEAYQELGFAAQQSAVGVDEMKFALLQLERSAGEALKGGESAKAFHRLGISVRNAAGEVKPADELFGEAADKIAGLHSNSEKVAASMELFGRQGRALLPMLAQGSKGIEKLREEAVELGGGYDEHAIEASANFVKALHKQDFALQSLRGRIASSMLPVLQKLVDGTTYAVGGFIKLVQHSRFVDTALVALGSVLAAFAARAVVAMLPVIAPFLFWGVVIAGVAAIMDDLWVTIRGGDSLTRRLIDGFFGVGSTAKVIETLRDAWKSLTEWIGKAWDRLTGFVDYFDNKADFAVKKIGWLLGRGEFKQDKDAGFAERAANRVNYLAGGKNGEFKQGTGEGVGDVFRRVIGGAGAPDGELYGSERTQSATALLGYRPSALVPATRRRGGGVTQIVHKNVTINAPNADANEVKRLFDEHDERTNRDAAADLTQIAEPEGD